MRVVIDGKAPSYDDGNWRNAEKMPVDDDTEGESPAAAIEEDSPSVTNDNKNIEQQQQQQQSTSSSSAKKFTVSSPPRWRFVNTAKSSLGYSSASAGKVVDGECKLVFLDLCVPLATVCTMICLLSNSYIFNNKY